MTQERWEHFQHDADIGVRGYGPTRETALEQAALAAMAVITDLRKIHPDEPVEIHCDEPDNALLLADWINAIVFEVARRHMLFSRFEIHLEDSCLAATAWGEKVDAPRHEPAAEIKGATYTELRMEPTPDGGWLAQCVVDV